MTEVPDQRSAIGDRREQVKAFDRPQRLNEGFSIKEEVGAVRDTDDLFKVYVPEWIIKFTSQQSGAAGEAEARAYFEEKFADRVLPFDVDFVYASSVLPDEFSVFVKLRLPNIKGEFKHRAGAEAFVAERGYVGAQVVSRNSREDYQLREYGQKKLTRAQLAAGRPVQSG